jgi:multicomponent Na+:H+ antiporter subunit F
MNGEIMIVFLLPLLLCTFFCLYRVGAGPTPADRTVAIDILGILMVGFCGILSLYSGKDLYMNVAISWSLLAFIGTIALAKYLEGRTFDE